MSWLNYHHLLYFWTVAREGSIAEASDTLKLSAPAISTQIKLLEAALGEKLFTRSGRGLALTEAGRIAFRYADEIFNTGREMVDALRGKSTARPVKLIVGIADVVPKLVAHRLLEPALALTPRVQITCREDKADRLLDDLSMQDLDLVIADAPVTGQQRVRAYNHPLGESTVGFFASPALCKSLRRGFPGSLDGAPMLLPTEGTVLRRSLDQWFDRHGLRPQVIAEFDDSALLKVFAQHGAGVFAAPTAIEREVRSQYKLGTVGHASDIVERFFAISVERRIRHPVVAVISEAARHGLFG